jgi:Transglycosylase SLT domain
VIRLWNRVGLYRALAVLLLLGAVAGGVAVAADRPTQQPKAADAAADSGPLDREALERQDAERAEAERAAREDAQRKANEAAAAAAEQAKKPSAKPSTSTKPGNPGKPVPPGPASCDVKNFKSPNAANKSTGCKLLSEFGFGLDQMGCLESLWIKESQWNPNAHNRSSGAHGIPQSLPASKMAKFGSDYMTNPATQIRWGLDYIRGRYGNPCGAWGHSQRTGWY